MWLNRLLLLAVVLASLAVPAPRFEGSPVAKAVYRPDTCAYCQADTWCELRANGKPQCRACKVTFFFQRFLYPPLGYTLQHWQRDDLRELYGKISPETGLRIYRKGYWSMGKQNGKTFVVAGLPLYHLECEEEFQPEAYVVASAKDQAGVAFRASALLVRSNSVLASRYKVIESVKRIVRRDGSGIFAVLAADGDVQDGKRPSLLLFDELHRFTRKKAETARTVLMKGFLSRDIVKDGMRSGEPLMLQTTTSGDELESSMWAHEYDYAQHVIDGSIQDETYFARIYQADPKRIASESEYWMSKEARVAANPSHQDKGGFLSDAVLEKEMTDAIRRPEKRSDYIRLNLNVPVVSTGTPIIEMPLWCAGGGPLDLRTWPERPSDEYLISKWGLADRPCYAGIDMGWTTDMASVGFLFPPYGDDEKWKVLSYFWLPKERMTAIERVTRAPLGLWERQRWLETSEGAEINQSVLMEKIQWGAGMFDLREVTFDKWGGIKAACNLILVPEGMTCVEVPQTIAGLTAGTKAFIGAYMNQVFEHGNHPILNWNASCLALVTDGGDNCKPVKPPRDTASKRIDGLAAIIMAWSRAMTCDTSEHVYATRGAIFL